MKHILPLIFIFMLIMLLSQGQDAETVEFSFATPTYRATPNELSSAAGFNETINVSIDNFERIQTTLDDMFEFWDSGVAATPGNVVYGAEGNFGSVSITVTGTPTPGDEFWAGIVFDDYFEWYSAFESGSYWTLNLYDAHDEPRVTCIKVIPTAGTVEIFGTPLAVTNLATPTPIATNTPTNNYMLLWRSTPGCAIWTNDIREVDANAKFIDNVEIDQDFHEKSVRSGFVRYSAPNPTPGSGYIVITYPEQIANGTPIHGAMPALNATGTPALNWVTPIPTLAPPTPLTTGTPTHGDLIVWDATPAAGIWASPVPTLAPPTPEISVSGTATPAGGAVYNTDVQVWEYAGIPATYVLAWSLSTAASANMWHGNFTASTKYYAPWDMALYALDCQTSAALGAGNSFEMAVEVDDTPIPDLTTTIDGATEAYDSATDTGYTLVTAGQKIEVYLTVGGTPARTDAMAYLHAVRRP